MLIINAEFPAGLTIKQAIEEALDFSEKNHCMVKCDINDVVLTIVAGLLPRHEAVEYYKNKYEEELKANADERS